MLNIASVPEEWREHCFLLEDKIFTPRFDEQGVMTANGQQVYEEWLAQSNTALSVSQRLTALEEDIELILSGATV